MPVAPDGVFCYSEWEVIDSNIRLSEIAGCQNFTVPERDMGYDGR
jgi:hypothetical protein